jgi:hypothetical protein
MIEQNGQEKVVRGDFREAQLSPLDGRHPLSKPKPNVTGISTC